jgi:hypothetical protein
MITETISGLKLISDLFVSIAGQLNRLKGTPKQQFAREVLELFDILDSAEKSIVGAIKGLDEYNSESDVAAKVSSINSAGFNLGQFSKTCKEFIYWIEHHEQFTDMLRILQPEVKDTLSEILHFDHAFTKEGEAVYKYFHTYVVDFSKELQATRSPDPKKFPTRKTVKLAMQQLVQVTEQINSAKRILREFASSNLTIDDFFR